MTISFELQTTEDLKLMEPLLELLKKFEVKVHITPSSGATQQKEISNSGLPKAVVSEHLHGIIKLPKGFDYKDQIATGLLDKYGIHG